MPREVQRKIIAICEGSLGDNGLACISYSTMPGYQIDMAVRDMMLFHVEGLENADERLDQGRTFLEYMVRVLDGADHPYLAYMKSLCDSMDTSGRNFYHEFLNVESCPLYFSEFTGLLAEHDLQYVCEALPKTSNEQSIAARAGKELSRIPQRLRREQYLDFLTVKRVRQSLICRKKHRLSPIPRPGALFDLFLSSPVKAQGDEPDWEGDSPVTFASSQGVSLTTRHPRLKAALKGLIDAWPLTVAFYDLVGIVEASLPPGSEDHDGLRHSMACDLVDCHGRGIVELRQKPVDCVAEPGTRPTASALARYEAEHNDNRLVTNQRHETGSVDEITKNLLPLLDGSRSREDLVATITARILDGRVEIRDGESQIRDPAVVPAYAAVAVDKSLRRLARHAFLVA